MKLVKSLLLGSAAGFAAVASASAADLPSRKAAPAEYVRVCSAYGAGFFYIPGTDVCLKVGGRALYQAQYAEPAAAGASHMGYRGLARFELDARNATAYGTLRAFVRLDVAHRTGNDRSGSGFRQGIGIDSGAAGDSGVGNVGGGSNRAQTQVILDKAFIQWGGLVAGRTNSLFAYNKSNDLIGVQPTDALWGTNLIGYIATFGAGFYASLSAEDPITRRQALSNAGNFATPNPVAANVVGGIFNGFATNSGELNILGGVNAGGAIPAGTLQYYAGSRMPDIVAAIGVEQSWGGAQISAAIHQLPVIGNPNPALGVAAPNVSSKYGWAVNGGVQINLPMLGAGDYLWIQAAYADGATSYVHSNWMAAHLNNQSVKNSNAYWAADAYYNPATNTISKSKTWAVNGEFIHYWTPGLRSWVHAGYSEWNNPGNLADWRYWAAGVGTFWSPVRLLDIGGQVSYQRIERRGGGNVVQSVATSNQVGKNSDGAWIARFRIVRSF